MSDEAVYDAGAELALLAGLIAFPQTRIAVARLVQPTDFWNERHVEIASVIADVDGADPQAVMTLCQRRGFVHAVPLLPKIVGRETVAEHVLLHAQTVRDCARRRRSIAAAIRHVQSAENPAADHSLALVELMGVVEELVDTTSTVDEPPIALDDFLAGEDHVEWVVEGLLARTDRVMLTGHEGGGKSELSRQVAVCVAAGVHPFTLQHVTPRTVVLVDLENSRSLLRTRLRKLRNVAAKSGRQTGDRLRIIHRPQGVDLGDPSDAAWLTRQVELAKPDLVVAGPLYRMHLAALDKEEAARQITATLDTICHRTSAALLLEAHAGHGVGGQRWWRPKGSSLFMAWAHFGLGLRTFKGKTEVSQWRGGRDMRAWPEALRRGPDDGWPWLEDVPVGGAWSEDGAA